LENKLFNANYHNKVVHKASDIDKTELTSTNRLNNADYFYSTHLRSYLTKIVSTAAYPLSP